MPTLVWRVGCPPSVPPGRLADDLRVAHRIDIEFRRPFNTHFVSKDAVKDHGRRMIGHSGPEPVLGICLFPCSPVFQTNDRSAGQPAEVTGYAAYNKIELGALGTRSSFLLGDLSVTLQPSIEFLQLFRRKLV